jgi:hypothetical protein
MLPIQKLFSSNERLFNLTTEGITQEESLKELQNCNSANWVVGHIAYLRNNILSQLGLPPVADEAMKPLYSRGTKLDASKAFHFDVLKKIYVDSHLKIFEGVLKLKDEAILEQVTFMGFHEAYHIGQIGLLRKMLGKEGAL